MSEKWSDLLQAAKEISENKDAGSKDPALVLDKNESEKIRPTENKYFSDGQEFSTKEYLEFLQDRDAKIKNQAETNLAERKIGSQKNYESELNQEIHRLKYFSVLFISAPHVGEDVNGYFPGEPTPLMYATSVLDRYVRTDTFPAATSPEIVAMMNPGQFDDNFIQQLIERVKIEKPRVVGISNTSEGHFFAQEIAKIIKTYSPETLIILGGAHEDGVNAEAYLKLPLTERPKTDLQNQPTLNNEQARELFDLVVSGDAPYALAEIFKIIANNKNSSNREIIQEIVKHRKIFEKTEGVGNISAVASDGGVETISLSGTPLDWNKLPLMFRGRLTTENRFPIFGGKKTAQIMTQMGCKYGCSFCMESLSAGLYKTNKSGKPTIKKSLEEIEILIKDYGYEAVFFDDSTFTQNPKKTDELMDGIIDLEQRDVKFEWGCQTAFADIPDKKFLQKMQQAGCTYIYFGFEQIEEKIYGKGKRVKTEKVEEVLAWCKELNLRTGVSLQFGLEGLGQYRETIDYIASLYSAGLLNKNSVAININTPYPGTKEWLNLEKKPDFNQKLQRHPRFESAHQLSNLTMDKVNEIYAYARQNIGDGLIGVEYNNQEIQHHLERYRQEFSNDFYFDGEQYGKYLNGNIEALHLNHASISNRPNEITELTELAAKLTEGDWNQLTEQARDQAAKLVGVKKEDVFFGRNTTEAMKLISWLVGMKEGDRVMLSNAENKSIVRLFEMNMDHGNPTGNDPWSTFPTFYQNRGKKYGDTVDELTGVETDVVDVINETLEDFYTNIENNLTPQTKCFVLSHVIRDTGKEMPIKEICEFVRKKKKEISPSDPDIFIIIDGAQALGNLPQINFADIGCDAYVGTPHKTMGSTPLGLGFINSANPLVKNNLPKLNKLFWQDQQVILDGMIDPSLDIKPNVKDSIDRMDIFGFKHAIDKLSDEGYKNGNFEKISARRRELKKHFQGIIENLANKSNLTISQMEQGTDFIYSFSLSGVDNREFAKMLSEQGIFVSYIDRTKLQLDDGHRVGNGVIRVSFGQDNTKEEIDRFEPKISAALNSVTEKEFLAFESQVEDKMVFKKPDNIVYLSDWIKSKISSPLTKVAAAATIFLTILSYNLLNRATKIDVDQKFMQTKLAELDDYQKTYASYRELFERDGFQHRIVEEMSISEYMMEKYKFLTNLGDEHKINSLLADEASIQLVAGFDYSDEERAEINNVFKQTGNKKLEKLLNLLT